MKRLKGFGFILLACFLSACSPSESSDHSALALNSSSASGSDTALVSGHPYDPFFSNKVITSLTFSPDEKTVVFEAVHDGKGSLFTAVKQDDGWSDPKVPSFAMPDQNEGNPFLTADGKTIYYTSDRPINGSNQSYDIWYVDKTSSGWSRPRNMGAPINTAGEEFAPTVSSNRTIYYVSSSRPGQGDIYCSVYKDGKYAAPVKLGAAINTDVHESSPYIAPDESFLIFKRNLIDLYISYRVDSTWTKAIPIDAKIKEQGTHTYYGTISPDGKRFIYVASNGLNANSSNVYQISVQAIGLSE